MTDHPFPSGRESAAEPVLRSRLLPRISFQSLLLLTAVSALVIAVVYAADQGGVYATAAAAGLFFAFCMFLVSAMAFLAAWAVSFLPRIAGAILLAIGFLLVACRIASIQVGNLNFLKETIWLLNFQLVGWFLLLSRIGVETKSGGESPFADDQLPPQIFAPREPSNS